MTEKKVLEHYQKHSVTEWEHIPEHDQRKDTKEFRNAKHELESIEHLPCYICGSMGKRESHHIFERCWGNVFDFKKVAFMLFNHFDFHGHCHRDFKDAGELLDWFAEHFDGHEETITHVYVDEETGEEKSISETIMVCDDKALDTIYNQLILSEGHHRTEGHSAHGSSFATFTALTAARHDFAIAYGPKEYEAIAKADHDEKHGPLNSK